MKSIFVLATFSLITSLMAGNNMVGDWDGVIHFAQDLPLVLNVTDTDGALSATLDSPSQGANGIPVDSVALNDQEFNFSIAVVNGGFSGKINAAKNEVSGTWTQAGLTAPLTLKLETSSGNLGGAWQGTLSIKRDLRIQIHITEQEGALQGTLDSLDQQAFGMGIDEIKREGQDFSFQIYNAGATYAGTINAAEDQIEGTWSQGGGNGTALNFKKAKKE